LRSPAALLRIATAALFFLVGEWVYLVREGGNSLVVVWTRDLYHATYFNQVQGRLPQLAERVPQWATLLAYADPVVVGIVLVVGIAAGLHLARAALDRWRKSVGRIDDG
jgi:hypothetical protein